MEIAVCRLLFADCRLQIVICRLQIVVCSLLIEATNNNFYSNWNVVKNEESDLKLGFEFETQSGIEPETESGTLFETV